MSMYKADRLYEAPQPPVTSVMYRMDPLVSTDADTPQLQQPKLPNDRRGRLYQRQMKTLNTLKYLLDVTTSLAGKEGAGMAKLGKHGQVQPGADQAAKTMGCSIVVRSKPSNPPAATLLLAEHLKNQGVKVDVCQHWHSSLGAPPANFKAAASNASFTAGVTFDLQLTVVWTNDVEETTATTSAAAGTPLLHDYNAARLIARCFRRFYPTDAETTLLTDDFVDAARSLGTATSKEKKNALKSINMRVGKGGFLLGDSFTVADACLWAALRSQKLSLPSNVKKWSEAITASPEVSAVEQCLA